MSDPTKTVMSELEAMGLTAEDTLIKYLKARRMINLEVFRLAGHSFELNQSIISPLSHLSLLIVV